MEAEDFINFSDEAVEFAFHQSELALSESIAGFRQIVDRSYIAIAVFSSVLIYFFENKQMHQSYFLVVVACVCGILIIWPNLFPGELKFPGSPPHETIHPFYEKTEASTQLREMYISKLIAHSKAIAENDNQRTNRQERFRTSTTMVLLTIGLAFCLSVITYIQ